MKVHPDEFGRLVADAMPQSIITQLIDELLEIHSLRGLTHEEATNATADFIIGFQAGWVLAKAVYHDE